MAREHLHRVTAALKAILAASALALALAPGLCGTLARADDSAGERHPQDARLQRTDQLPPPARVILPAPWEPTTPTRPVPATAGSAGRK